MHGLYKTAATMLIAYNAQLHSADIQHRLRTINRTTSMQLYQSVH